MELENPQEILKRRKERKEAEEIQKQEESKHKFLNKGGKLRINYESEGRFSIADHAYYIDYTTRDINDLMLSREEDLLETIVAILNTKISFDDELKSKAEDMILEEFLETLVGMKAQYNNPIHEHKWLHKCQDEVPDDDKKLSSAEIDLRELKYTSIEEADEEIRKIYKPVLESLYKDKSVWIKFIKTKYPDKTDSELQNITLENVLQETKIQEPITFSDHEKGNIYKFKFNRVGDLIRAKQRAYNEIAPDLKRIKRKTYPGMPLEKQKALKEEEIKKLEHDRGKKVIFYMQAFTLLEKNGKVLNEEEQIVEYTTVPPKIWENFISLKEKIIFGINDDRELICEHCKEKDRRYLQRSFDPIEFLPINIDPKRELSQSTTTFFHFG